MYGHSDSTARWGVVDVAVVETGELGNCSYLQRVLDDIRTDTRPAH
jgi:hypothetical protein